MKKYAVVGGVAVGVGSVVLASAAIAGPVRVTVGSNTTGSFPITAASTTQQKIVTQSNATFICQSASVPAAASGVPGSTVNAGAVVEDAALIGRVNLNSCVGPSNLQLRFTHIGTWKLRYISGATSAANDTNVKVQIDDIKMYVDNPPRATICDFDVKGSMRGSYNEATGVLTLAEPGGVGGLLKVDSVRKGCWGIAVTGQTIKYDGALKVTSAGGPIRFG